MSREQLTLICSLDVEEEGLFSGSYCLTVPPVTNVACLTRLRPLLDMGVRPTLFCSHAVLSSDMAWRTIDDLASRYPLETGLHLHHWNTPPVILPGTAALKVPSCDVPTEKYAEKIDTLQAAIFRRTGSPATSFRMGKWDIRAQHWAVLARSGILADASVRPLHAQDAEGKRPDHFKAPAQPYRIPTEAGDITEVPLTVTPLLSSLPGLLLGGGKITAPLLASFEHWGALALLPVYHPLWAMQAVTRLAAARGARVISLTWHSSEMWPGGNPHLGTPQSIDKLMTKVGRYLEWLTRRYDVRFLTLGEYRASEGRNLPALVCSPKEDWSVSMLPPNGSGTAV